MKKLSSFIYVECIILKSFTALLILFLRKIKVVTNRKTQVLMVKLKSSSKTYAMKIIKKSIIDDEDDIEWVQTEKNVFEQASNHPFLV